MKRFVDNPRFSKAMKKIGRVLRGIPWALIGGRAAEVWVNPPQTPDIDILVSADEASAYELIDLFAKESVTIKGRNDVEEDEFALFLYDRELRVDIDVMRSYDEFDLKRIKRSKKIKFGSAKSPVLSLEDLIILKAGMIVGEGGLFSRGAKKKRDIELLSELASTKPRPDWSYISKTLKDEGLVDEFNFLASRKWEK